MAQTFITNDVIAKEALMHLKNNLVFANQVHREYKNELMQKVGETVRIRKPVKFVTNDGQDITNNIQDVSEATINLTMNKWKNVAWEFSSRDRTLSLEKYSERYVQPAMLELANIVDYDLAGLYVDVFHTAGVAGTTPNEFGDLGDLNAKMDMQGVPRKRNMVLNPDAAWGMMNGLKGIYNEGMAKQFVQDGLIHKVAGMSIFQDQNVRTHTHNTLTGTPLIDTVSSVTYITTGDNASQSTIHVDGISAGDTVVGDVFTVADVYAVNPKSRASTGKLQEFTVTAAVAQATDMPLVVKPAIYASGAYQTVDAAPVDGAAVTFLDTHVANLGFHRNAFALVVVPIDLLPNVKSTRITDSNLSLRITEGGDFLKSTNVMRIDILYGVKTIYPELAARMLG